MNKYFVLFISVVLLAIGISSAAIAGKTDRKSPHMVRVAIVREARQIDLEIEGQYTFRDESGKPILRGPRLAKSTVRLLDKGIFVGMNVYPYKRLIIQPKRDATVIINKHHFRGEVLLIRTPEDRITAVNSINIEDYIKGVLYHEVSHHWPMEALKAQAVATRTYALYSMGGAAGKEYDVTNDIYSQVYGGKNSERYRTGLAVDRSTGEILVYGEKILPAYFHATCAGMTEDAKELWEINLAPLKGVPCLFCQDSPHMHWKKNFRLGDIEQLLNKRGYKTGLIKDIAIVDRDRSGRISTLKITSREGQETVVKGKDFREAIGPNVLKSNSYDIEMKGYYVDFVGKGWGHGVGMCQWGARGMAAQQFTYKQVLAYYYPGSQLIDYHDLPAGKKPSASRAQ
jgi:stage II sporulation protein D